MIMEKEQSFNQLELWYTVLLFANQKWVQNKKRFSSFPNVQKKKNLNSQM